MEALLTFSTTHKGNKYPPNSSTIAVSFRLFPHICSLLSSHVPPNLQRSQDECSFSQGGRLKRNWTPSSSRLLDDGSKQHERHFWVLVSSFDLIIEFLPDFPSLASIHFQSGIVCGTEWMSLQPGWRDWHWIGLYWMFDTNFDVQSHFLLTSVTFQWFVRFLFVFC